MRGDPRSSSRSRPVADGGARHAALFEAFPDPLLAYADGAESDEGDGGSGANPGSFVVRGVNPAFEAAFGLGDEEVTGTPLGRVALPGTVSTAPGADDVTGETDGSRPDHGEGADAGTADPVAPDAVDAADRRGTDDADATVPPPTTTASSLLDRIREGEAAVRFEHPTADGTRHFRVRAVTTGAGEDRGYLLFTEVTEPERRRRDLAATVARLERIVDVARHDIRNPLEVAEIRLEAARDTGEDVHLEKVAGALDRIEDIVRDVLAVGGGVDPTDAVPLRDVAEAAWETVDTADATLLASPGLPTVRGDADRLRQLFENVFRNSVEHGPAGGRSEADEAVERDDRGVTVTVEPFTDGFAVADDGPGLPADVAERAFEAGYSTAPDNSGLGLSIVRQIAREHGWRVSLASGRRSSTDAGGGARLEFTGVERVGNGTDPGGPGGPN